MADTINVAPLPTPVVQPLERNTALVHHTSLKVTDLEEIAEKYAEKPRRSHGTSTHSLLSSLVAHALRHKGPATVAFVDEEGIRVVYNYSEGGNDPGHKDHVAKLPFLYTDAFKAWQSAGRGELILPALQELLAVRGDDIVSAPEGFALQGARFATASELRTLADNFAVRIDSHHVERRNRDDGTAELLFKDAHEVVIGGGPVRVPNAFVVSVAIFEDDAPVLIPVRLRYRINSGKSLWRVEPVELDIIVRKATRALAKQLADATGLPLFLGTPEGSED